MTALPNRTSPVVRGKWVLQNLLGAPPPEPPPNVPALEENGDQVTKVQTLRERLEQHRANPVCASCHKLMDPIGFALENFDAVGKYRTFDENFEPIDNTGVYADGTQIDGLAGLRQVLVNHSDQFLVNVTKHAADLRAGPRRRVLRRAGGPRDPARRGAAATIVSRRSFSASSRALHFR